MPTTASLHHVAYISDATHPMSVPELEFLLAQARAFNTAHHLTGLLLYSEGLPGTSSPGSFFQILEGTEAVVRRMVARIRLDPRNVNLRVLVDGATARSLFADSSLDFATIIWSDMETLTSYVTLTGSRFGQPQARALSASLRTFIQNILAEYPAWPYQHSQLSA